MQCQRWPVVDLPPQRQRWPASDVGRPIGAADVSHSICFRQQSCQIIVFAKSWEQCMTHCLCCIKFVVVVGLGLSTISSRYVPWYDAIIWTILGVLVLPADDCSRVRHTRRSRCILHNPSPRVCHSCHVTAWSDEARRRRSPWRPMTQRAALKLNRYCVKSPAHYSIYLRAVAFILCAFSLVRHVKK